MTAYSWGGGDQVGVSRTWERKPVGKKKHQGKIKHAKEDLKRKLGGQTSGKKKKTKTSGSSHGHRALGREKADPERRS